MAEAAKKIDQEEIDTEHEEMTAVQVAEMLDKIGATVAVLRHEAVSDRKSCGIEEIWTEDEQFYEGIDEFNQDGDNNWNTKPPGRAVPGKRQTGSTIFLNITGPYCDIAASRMSDMLLPTDELNFSIRSTPIPELIKISNGEAPQDMVGQVAQQEGVTEDDAVSVLADKAESAIKEAKEKADNAQNKIKDWLVQCLYTAEVRKILEDCAKSGTGVLKGPVPEERKSIAFVDGEFQISKKIEPCSHRVDYWNCYPDPSCGESIHNGSYFFERDTITRKKLRELKGSGLYFDYQIDRVLAQGPMDVAGEYKKDQDYVERGLRKSTSKGTFSIWYGCVCLKKEEIEKLGLEFDSDDDEIDIKITMVNNIVIQMVQNHMDTGEFPYDFMVFKKRKNSPFGCGVSRQVRTPQRLINAAARSLMDNAGIASGPMWAINDALIEPINGIAEIAPLKGWRLGEDAEELDDIRKAFTFFDLEMRQEDLQAIIRLGMDMAEHVTGMPLILQGHTGNAPDTVGGMRMLQNNASTTLRRIAKLFDDLITEMHMRRYYAYLLQYGPDDCKGDFQIDAQGSSALVERDIQNESINNMGSVVTNPMFGLDPKKWAKEWLASQRLDSSKFEYDDEQWQQIVEGLSQPSADPRLEIENMKVQWQQQKLQQEQEFKAMEAEKDRQLELFFKDIEIENQNLIEAGKQELTAAQIQTRYQEHSEKMRADLEKKRAELQLQERLSMQKSAPSTIQVDTPPTEPAGRAPDGNAYQR